MALWKDQAPPKKESVPSPIAVEPIAKKEEIFPAEAVPTYEQPRRTMPNVSKESIIGSDITIEGKIDGAGHVRIAGKFKGDVHVEGNLTIEMGAKVTGGVKANSVVIGGELDGNVIEAARVELLESGVLNGDLKAGSLTVAAGSRMRGHVEFGWEGKAGRAPGSDEGTR